MAAYESSIVIPVYNRWDLTRGCLKSLAGTTPENRVEVIVVDNASTDVTPAVCEALGKNLFGESFRYIRNDINRNFAGASNQGASCAKGEYVIFLNNDTETLPGWYEPLLADFHDFPNLAATGPLLLFPEDKIFGHTVQHLGVLVSPSFRFGHLYAGIPADSPLAKKRRFFQIITAACMAMSRNIFLNAGGFDEEYINGFEDVDLCARLTKAGYRMSVNPDCRVIHYESMTPGRKERESDNFERALTRAAPLLRVDWHEHLKNDGLEIAITDFLFLRPSMPALQLARLDRLAEKLGTAELKKLLVDFPYWEKGLAALADMLDDAHLRLALYEKLFMLYKDPEYLIKSFEMTLKAGKKFEARQILGFFSQFMRDQENYTADISYAGAFCKKLGLDDLARQYEVKMAAGAGHEAGLNNLRKVQREMENRIAG